MMRILQSIYRFLVMFGIDPRKTIYSLRGLPHYIRNGCILKSQKQSSVKEFPFGMPYPRLSDRFLQSGSNKGHYFHQDLLVARRIYYNSPSTHVDIGSRIDGFVAHVASFRHIEVLDIRPLSKAIPNIKFSQADLMVPVKTNLTDYCDSLSCLHSIEHFGLGRYGDPVNYDGYILGLNNLYNILKKGGKLYFSVPIGSLRIEFDAHRVFSMSYLLQLFDGKYHIDHFSYVDDFGDLHENVLLEKTSEQDSFDCVYGCGIFELTKI